MTAAPSVNGCDSVTPRKAAVCGPTRAFAWQQLPGLQKVRVIDR